MSAREATILGLAAMARLQAPVKLSFCHDLLAAHT